MRRACFVLTITTPSRPCFTTNVSVNARLLAPGARKFPSPPSTLDTAAGHVTHLLPVQTRLIRLDDDVLLARYVQPRALHLLRLRVVLVRADDFLHFLGRDVEVRRGGPHGGAFTVEDGGLVDMAGADEARVAVSVLVGFGMGRDCRGEDVTWCRRMLWDFVLVLWSSCVEQLVLYPCTHLAKTSFQGCSVGRLCAGRRKSDGGGMEKQANRCQMEGRLAMTRR